jgi:hypothetical protein
MELDKNRFKKYAKIDIDNINEFEDINFISNLVNKMKKDLDNMYCEFLEENGYKIDKPYNIEQLKQIKEDLEKQDKFLDYVEYTEFSKNSEQAYHYVIPFFNSISNPLTEETRNEIIEKWKEKNRKDK